MSIERLPHFIPASARPVEAEAPAPDRVAEVAEEALAAMGNFVVLTAELLVMIAQKLDLNDLLNFKNASSVLNRFGEDHQIWRKIAQEIGCPLTEGPPVMNQVRTFILDLLEIVKPDDKGALTIARIKDLKRVVLANDILNVWGTLASTLNPLADVLEVFGEDISEFTSEQLIAKSGQFNAWFVANQNALAQITRLNLSDSNLTHIPPQLANLPSLILLNLSRNRLTQFPSALCTAPELTRLILSDNPLRASEVKLPRKLSLDEQFFKDLPYETQLEVAAQIGYPVDIIRRVGDVPMVLMHREFDRIASIKFRGMLPPETIRAIVRKDVLNLEELQHLYQWRKARDTLIVWEYLAKLTGILGVENDRLDTAEAYCDLATQFGNWLAVNRKALARLPILDFNCLGDVEIPAELCTPELLGKFVSLDHFKGQDRPVRQAIESFLGNSKFDHPYQFYLYLSVIAKTGWVEHPTLDEIRTLHDSVKQKDTIAIWLKLGQLLNPDATKEEILGANPTVAGFQEWFEANRTKLFQIQSLDFSEMELFHLPKEIGRLRRRANG